MDELGRINTFIKVVEAGSFSAVARDSSSISSVARQVKSLEDELGIRLLNRSTRRLSLTEAGRVFYERTRTIARDLGGAISEAQSFQDDVKGLLRVSLRVSTGTTVVIPALPAFLEAYPQLDVDITLTDERQDFIADNIDVAIWLGPLPDSELVARRLSPPQRIVCGSPEYFARHGTPQQPQDLQSHSCVLFKARSYGNTWRFSKDGQQQEIAVTGRVCSENTLVLLSTALAGLGLIMVHEYTVRPLIAEGRLVPVLGAYTASPRTGDADLYAVYTSSRGLSRKVRVFVDFLGDLFGQPQAVASD